MGILCRGFNTDYVTLDELAYYKVSTDNIWCRFLEVENNLWVVKTPAEMETLFGSPTSKKLPEPAPSLICITAESEVE